MFSRKFKEYLLRIKTKYIIPLFIPTKISPVGFKLKKTWNKPEQSLKAT